MSDLPDKCPHCGAKVHGGGTACIRFVCGTWAYAEDYPYARALRGAVVRDESCYEAEIEQLREDKARLDWLEDQTNGDWWVARKAETGRGYHLHNSSRTDSPGCGPTPRIALDMAMADAEEPSTAA